MERVGDVGDLTITDALVEFEKQGYVGQFVIRPAGLIECTACEHQYRPRDVSLESMHRLEGASDPADEVFVAALRCPGCGQPGTAVVHYGPTAPSEDGEILRQLSDHRRSAVLNDRADDDSMVRDTGWLRGPDG